MPLSRAFYASRSDADAAASAAVAGVRARYAAASALDPAIAGGTAPATEAPTAAFTGTAQSIIPGVAYVTVSGEFGPIVTGPQRLAQLTTTPDGLQAIGVIQGALDRGTDVTAHYTIGAPLDWRSRVRLATDGRWMVELYTLPEGT